jgi:hypothetical protein
VEVAFNANALFAGGSTSQQKALISAAFVCVAMGQWRCWQTPLSAIAYSNGGLSDCSAPNMARDSNPQTS